MRRIGRILGQLQKAQLPNRLTCELPEASAAACRGREARRERRERGEQLFSLECAAEDSMRRTPKMP